MSRKPNAENVTWSFPHCPQPPDWSLDWEGIRAEFDWLRDLDGCAQDPMWHEEGDVLVHTRMVCEALTEMNRWRELQPEQRSALFAAALLHDIAKPAVSREEGGRIRSPRHTVEGARIARTLLWQRYLLTQSFRHLQFREEIVGLVRMHGLPLHLLDERDPQRVVIGASQVVRLDLLAMLAEADVVGRRSRDQQELLTRVELFRESGRENRCYTAPRLFASEHTRFLYFQGRQLDPDCEVHDDTRLEVILMSGLPGTGKDHWITEHAADWPIVSLDTIRNDLDISPDDNQGAVVTAAKERARGHLRRSEPFVWNATNTTRPMRAQLISLFHQYRARIRIVYAETLWEELLRRNRRRSAPVPQEVITKLARKLDVPDVREGHRVESIVS